MTVYRGWDGPLRFEGMYELLVFVHVLGAVVWLGSGVFAQVQARKAFATSDRAVIGGFMESIEAAAPIIFNVFPPLTLLAGIGLVIWSPAWGFSQFWVYGALVLVAVTIVFGAVLSNKAMIEVRKAVDDDDGAGLTTAVARMTRFGNIDLLVLLAILALMVFKPGL